MIKNNYSMLDDDTNIENTSNTQGNSIIKAIINGSNMVQQKDIN